MTYETLMAKLQGIKPNEAFKKNGVLEFSAQVLENLFANAKFELSLEQKLRTFRGVMDLQQSSSISDKEDRKSRCSSEWALAELRISSANEIAIRQTFSSIETSIENLYRCGFNQQVVEYAERYRALVEQSGL